MNDATQEASAERRIASLERNVIEFRRRCLAQINDLDYIREQGGSVSTAAAMRAEEGRKIRLHLRLIERQRTRLARLAEAATG